MIEVMNETVGAEFLRVAAKQFEQSLEKIEKAVSRLTIEQVWERRHETENSVGNLLLHLEGNVRQWILAGVGGAPDERDRDAEFAERSPISPAELLSRLRATVGEAVALLERLPPERLLDRRRVQVYDLTALNAVFHCVEHFGGHAGQILWAVKRMTGEDLGFYNYLKKGGGAPESKQP